MEVKYKDILEQQKKLNLQIIAVQREIEKLMVSFLKKYKLTRDPKFIFYGVVGAALYKVPEIDFPNGDDRHFYVYLNLIKELVQSENLERKWLNEEI